MTWFDIIEDETGHYVAWAEGIWNAQRACETLVAEGYGDLTVKAVGARFPVATAGIDPTSGKFVWRSSNLELRYRDEGRTARR